MEVVIHVTERFHGLLDDGRILLIDREDMVKEADAFLPAAFVFVDGSPDELADVFARIPWGAWRRLLPGKIDGFRIFQRSVLEPIRWS
jgi:hypothetical protein